MNKIKNSVSEDLKQETAENPDIQGKNDIKRLDMHLFPP